jgi:zinc transport system substrate-binding protein
MNKTLTGALGALALVLAGCGDGGGDEATTIAEAEADATTVVASFYPLAEAAERVGGDRVTVENLTPAGSEPHDLEVSPRQVESVNAADLVVVMGRGFQPAVEQLADGRDGETLRVLSAISIPQAGEVEAHDHADDDGHGHDGGGDPADDDGHGHDDGGDHADDDGHGHGDDDHAEDDGHGHGEGALDPHVWLDPTLMAEIVDEVAHHLAEVDPDGAEEFERNAEAFRAELLDLDERFEETLSDCRHDLIVVQHEAFGWMTERYGLRQEGIAGLSPEQEPDPRRMAELVGLVEDEGINTVFTETLVSPRIAETLAREAGVETSTLNPIEGLTDTQKADGEDYVSIMESNLENLEAALGCG